MILSRQKAGGTGVCRVMPVGFAALQLEPATQSTLSPGTPASTQPLAERSWSGTLSLWSLGHEAAFGGAQLPGAWLGWRTGESLQDPV